VTARARLGVLVIACIVGLAPSLLAPGSVLAARGKPIVISKQLVITADSHRLVLCQDEIVPAITPAGSGSRVEIVATRT
jgi:hypothetical protein